MKDLAGPCPLPEVDVLHPLSVQYVASTSKDRRKARGQFFTPRPVRNRLLQLLPDREYPRILDPSCGTGEFLADCAEQFTGTELEGWEIDSEVADIARQVCPTSTIELGDALERGDEERFDLVIGNPPYFQFKCSTQLKDRYRAVISGRPNIFSFFFAIGLQALRPGGILAYVVPPSMNNGAYFEALRQHILQFSEVVAIEVLDDNRLFAGAQTAVQLIVLRKADDPNPSDRFVLRWGREQPALLARSSRSRTIFAQDADLLRGQFKGRQTLVDLGYRARTGRVVWNQNRDLLSRKGDMGCVPLLWAHNLASGAIELNNDHKRPQYVRNSSPDIGPAIVVNRITGAVGRGSLRAALVQDGMEFVGENHVNVITQGGPEPPAISYEELLDRLLEPGVQSRVQLLTGNTQVSATELNHLIPL